MSYCIKVGVSREESFLSFNFPLPESLEHALHPVVFLLLMLYCLLTTRIEIQEFQFHTPELTVMWSAFITKNFGKKLQTIQELNLRLFVSFN